MLYFRATPVHTPLLSAHASLEGAVLLVRIFSTLHLRKINPGANKEIKRQSGGGGIFYSILI